MQFTLVYFSRSIFVIVNSYILDFLNHNHCKMLLWSVCFHTRQLQGPLNTWASMLVSPPHIFIQGIDAQPIVRVAGLRWVTGENWLGDLEALSDGPWWFTRMEDCREMLDFSLTFFISFIKKREKIILRPEFHHHRWLNESLLSLWRKVWRCICESHIKNRLLFFFGRGFRGVTWTSCSWHLIHYI